MTNVGPDVDVLATHDDTPVLVRQGPVWGATFHPELSGDLRIHERFLAEASGRGAGTLRRSEPWPERPFRAGKEATR